MVGIICAPDSDRLIDLPNLGEKGQAPPTSPPPTALQSTHTTLLEQDKVDESLELKRKEAEEA